MVDYKNNEKCEYEIYKIPLTEITSTDKEIKKEFEFENSYLYNNNIISEIQIENYLMNLNFPKEFINSYSPLLSNKKLFYKSDKKEKNNFFSKIKKNKEIIKINNIYNNDNEKTFINKYDLLKILKHSNFFKKYSNFQIEASILITEIPENSPIGIFHFEKIKKNLLKIDENPFIIYDEIQKNYILLADEDEKISKLLEYRDIVNEPNEQKKDKIKFLKNKKKNFIGKKKLKN